MLPQYFVYLTIFTSIFAGSFYLRAMWRGQAKPNLVSWLVWVLAPVSAGLVSISLGAGESSVPIFMAAFTPLCVVILGLYKKSAHWKASTLDYVCLALSLISLLSFIILKTGTLATTFAILADLIAFVPTYIKSYKAPESENLGPYLSGLFNPFISVATLSAITFNTAGFALYLFLGNLLEIAIVLIRKKFKK